MEGQKNNNALTNTEFDLLDELYFVADFKTLQQTLSLPEKELVAGLKQLAIRGFINLYFPDPDTEVEFDPASFEQACGTYLYLASKKGLLAHNSR